MTRQEVEILDLGVNNVASLKNAFVQAGVSKIRVVETPDQSIGADLLVLPGVGAFAAAMDVIRDRGLDSVIEKQVSTGDFLMGVCLGMQMLSDSSDESAGVPGLSLVPGHVTKLSPNATARVPNIGWDSAELVDRKDSQFQSLQLNLDFYFVHSYSLQLSDSRDSLTKTPFGDSTFVSAVLRDNIVGFQFHPEKSSKAGQLLILDVLSWANG